MKLIDWRGDVEYAEKMERFRAELVTSSGTCLCAKSTFLPHFPGRGFMFHH